MGQLAARDRDWLIATFGKATGAWMHEVAWGRDNRPVVTESEPCLLYTSDAADE